MTRIRAMLVQIDTHEGTLVGEGISYIVWARLVRQLSGCTSGLKDFEDSRRLNVSNRV